MSEKKQPGEATSPETEAPRLNVVEADEAPEPAPDAAKGETPNIKVETPDVEPSTEHEEAVREDNLRRRKDPTLVITREVGTPGAGSI